MKEVVDRVIGAKVAGGGSEEQIQVFVLFCLFYYIHIIILCFWLCGFGLDLSFCGD